MRQRKGIGHSLVELMLLSSSGQEVSSLQLFWWPIHPAVDQNTIQKHSNTAQQPSAQTLNQAPDQTIDQTTKEKNITEHKPKQTDN